MSVKSIIIVLIIGILLSLASSLFFLFKDRGEGKTVYGLGIRVTLAILLIILVAYGLSTGELGNSYIASESL